MIAGMIVAVAIPLAFLALVRWLDLYASESIKGVLVCFGWGLVAFFLALEVNTALGEFVGFTLLVTFFAPMIEEVCKSLILVYYVRRADFTYFVDGAIYGFAAGTCFAVLENLFYLSSAEGDAGLVLAFGRAFSTALMHGSATALVGIALGRFRFGRGRNRIVSLLLGWAAAMSLHITFNNVVNLELGLLTQLLAIVLGLGGVGLVIVFIFWGLRDEKRWLRETLNEKLHVSEEEASIVQHLDDLDTLLEPVQNRFGKQKAGQVRHFMYLEAKMGIKREADVKTADPKRHAELEAQIQRMEGELDKARRDVGFYVMTSVRSIMPPTDWSLWARLGHAMSLQARRGAPSLYAAISPRLALAAAPASNGADPEIPTLYTRVTAETEARARADVLTEAHVHELPDDLRKTMHWVMQEEKVVVHHLDADLTSEEQELHRMLAHLADRGFLHRVVLEGRAHYRPRIRTAEKALGHHIALWHHAALFPLPAQA